MWLRVVRKQQLTDATQNLSRISKWSSYDCNRFHLDIFCCCYCFYSFCTSFLFLVAFCSFMWSHHNREKHGWFNKANSIYIKQSVESMRSQAMKTKHPYQIKWQQNISFHFDSSITSEFCKRMFTIRKERKKKTKQFTWNYFFFQLCFL